MEEEVGLSLSCSQTVQSHLCSTVGRREGRVLWPGQQALQGDTLRRGGPFDFSAILNTRLSRRILEGAMPATTGSMTVGVGAMQVEVALRVSLNTVSTVEL